MKKILIIGSTGSTGLYLTDLLSRKDYEITATGYHNRNLDIYNRKGINYISLNISKKEDFYKLPTNFDCAVLLAGMMPARMKGYDPFKYIDVNIIGTLNTLEFCRINKIPKVIFAQSHSDVYGHWNTGHFIKDDASRILNYKGDHAVYIISKCAATDLMEHYHQEYNIQSIIFRLPTIYAYWPDDTMYVNGVKKTMAYLALIKKAIAGQPIEIWGDPSITKDIVYVKDFVQMVEKAIISNSAQGIFNVGTGIPTSLEDQIRGIIEVFCDPNNMSEIIFCPDKPSQTSYLYDVSKAKKDLGYVVKYPYIEMLKDMKSEINNPWFKNTI